MKKIIVLTPVKNEEWILDTFLTITSKFADHIIIAYQHSTDRTLEIAKRYPKVEVVLNESKAYDEASRQHLLISNARNKFGLGNILLALDADEILAFNALHSKEWHTIKNSAPGTVLFFEKPTYYDDISSVIRYESEGGWPLGYVDDGVEHTARIIHSTRIPFLQDSPRLYLKEIKFLHLNLLSLARQRAKIRYYCMLENLANSKPWYHRLRFYNKNYNYATEEGDGLAPSDPEWTIGWRNQGIQFKEADLEKYYWYDREALKLLIHHGSTRFWWDDVWDIDWTKANQNLNGGSIIINTPPYLVRLFRHFSYRIIRVLYLLKRAI